MWRVKGVFRMGKRWVKFEKEIEAPSEKLALEKILSILGSKHKVKRRYIKVEVIERV